jgi:hypothetical protein
MAKTPAKAADKPSTKPKAASKKAGGSAEAPAKGAKKPKIAAKDATASKPKKAATSKPAAAKASTSGIAQFARDTTDAISTLASDILADRIVPTIEQIKAVAAHALGRDEKSKRGRKAPKKK